MTTPCYNTRCADLYAHQLGNEAEQQEAIEREIENMFESLDDRFIDAITRQMAENKDFEAEIEQLALLRIRERNLP